MKIAEKVVAYLIIFINYIIPKHKNEMKRGIVFCDMGIGNFVFLMPIIKALSKKFEITLVAEKPEIIAIIDAHFECSRKISGKYDFSINNYFVLQRKNILKILKLRIPLRIGQVNKKDKFYRFFNKHIPFDEINYELYQNYKLIDFLGVEKERLFFEINKYIHDKPYFVVQPRSYTDKGKNTDLRELIEKLLKAADVILIGHDRENVDLPGINLIGKTTILDAAGIIKGCMHFYCLESGLSHIAIAMKIPTTIFLAQETPKRVMHDEAEYVKKYSIQENV